MLADGTNRDRLRLWFVMNDGEFTEWSPAGATEMATRLNGSALPLVNATAVLAPPSISGQGGHFFAQRVIDRDAEAVLVHARHHAPKIHTVIRAALQNIVLPLMNHFMRQGHDGFVILLGVVFLKKHCR